MGLIINEIPSPPGSPQNVTYQVTNLTVTDPEILVNTVQKETVVVQGTANFAPPGPRGPAGVHVGTTPPEDLDVLWVKI